MAVRIETAPTTTRSKEEEGDVDLNSGQDENELLRIRGYKANRLKTALAHLVSISLLGLPYLIGRWKPGWKVKCFKSLCNSLRRADTMLITSSGSAPVVVPVCVTDAPPIGIPTEFVHTDDDDQSNPEISDSSRLLETSQPRQTLRHFTYRHSRYFWTNRSNSYERLRGLDEGQPVSRFATEFSRGLNGHQRLAKRLFHGDNSIEVEVKSYTQLLFEEVLNPFYVFQLAAVALWAVDDYLNYAACILLISLASVVASLLETRRQSQSLHDMVSSSTAATRFHLVDGVEINSTDLVPGDVLVVPALGCVMPCDAVLLSGTCIVNEAALTGESVPVTKSSLTTDDDAELYDPQRHKPHTLFAGTTVIQTRYYGESRVLAAVTSTGFDTARGELVRSILFPRPVKAFKFHRDSMRFVGVLFVTAAIGMLYCVYVYVSRNAAASTILLRCLDIVTIVVPPALPAAMTVGTYYAQSRLRNASIFSISPQRINVCGKLKLVCFDKTGTLTEDGLDLWGVVATRDALLPQPELKNEFVESAETAENLPSASPILNCLASCHSLTLIDDKLIGDPLDVKMFEATGWILDESGRSDTSKFDTLMPAVVRPPNQGDFFPAAEYPHEVGIIRQFAFSSSVARMSVVTRTLGDDRFKVFTKGAPEKMEELCLPATVPANFHARLKQLTVRGFRVVALAYRVLPADVNWVRVQKMKRDSAERDLNFVGFLVMQNTLKPESKPVVEELRDADVKTVMITGDNLMTAISVARECSMIGPKDRIIVVEADPPKTGSRNPSIQFNAIEEEDQEEEDTDDDVRFVDGRKRNDENVEGAARRRRRRDYHFAMSGKSWSTVTKHFGHLVPKLVRKGTVFARMAPDQKAQLVEELQNIDYVVSMCGDGANDCSALKVAQVGISLSEAEASVAAPFTSKVPNITCVPTVIREGRCALVTSFGAFKYMALYSMVQFISVLLLYTLHTNLADNQFLYIDLAITTTVAILMGWTKPHDRKLVAKRPPGSLVSGPNLFSIFSQIGLSLLAQVVAYLYLTTMPWYVKVDPVDPNRELVACSETTTVFIMSSFQYLILATVYSKGAPYRKPFYTNLPYAIALAVLTSTTAILILWPGDALTSFFQLYSHLPLDYRFAVVGFAALNAFLCFCLEKLMADSVWLADLCRVAARKKRPKNRFKVVMNEMEEDGWPDVIVSRRSSLRIDPDVS